MKRSIFRRGILTLSLSAVLLGATAGSANAVLTLAPLSVDFGDRQVGTTSPPQAHTLTLRCPIQLGINGCAITGPISFSPVLSVSGEFSQTNNCPPLLTTSSTTGVTCTINSTFTPTSTGPKAGTLSTGTGGPTASLTGNGVTTPTPSTPPTSGPAAAPPPLSLILDAAKQKLKKTLKFSATTNHDAHLLALGSVKQTVVQLVAGQKTTIKATLKNKARKSLANKIERSGKATAKVQASATDQAGATAIDEIKVKLTG